MAASLPAFRLDSISINKLLRRSTLEPIVLALKVGLALTCFVLLVITIQGIIKQSLSTSKAITDLDQNLQQAKSKLSASKDDSITKNTNYKIISDKSLFGTISAPMQQNPQTQPKTTTKTPLNLVGTFVTEKEPPYAVVEDDKKKVQDVFGVGEMIFGEAKVLSISSDRIEIERNGERETLVIDETASRGDSAGGISSDGDHFTVDEKELDTALENLPLLLTQARAVPYFRDGKAMGLRLFAVKSGSLYEKLGLKNGDILKGINGNSLADLSQAMQLFEKLKTERSISLSLERNSEEKEVKYDIR